MLLNLANVIALTIAVLIAGTAAASELRLAVASNFAATARVLVDEYSAASGDYIVLLVGSTGKHTAQIQHGLKVDIFLAADSVRPKFLEDNGFAVAGSRSSYAIGRLALWSRNPLLVDANGDVLASSKFKRLAIANPKTAPYGVAAQQLLTALGVSPSLVNGESVGQAFQFANSGAAELALLAFAQVKDLTFGSQWLVPENLHQPIEQQLVLVQDSPSAREFLRFLSSEQALKIIESHGYGRPSPSGSRVLPDSAF